MSNMSFEWVFPSIQGRQANRDFYVSMCPLRLIPRIFLFNEEELVPELRAQRQLNRARIPELTRYIVDNRDDYVFSAITASIDGEVRFEGIQNGAEESKIGLLHIPMNARFVINDGQHRRAAVEAAIRDCPELADETIAVVFFLDVGLEKCQQMFADLNRYAIRPSKSLGVLYDHRDIKAQLTRMLISNSSVFRDVVELERTTLSARSRRLFTLSAIYHATNDLLANFSEKNEEKLAEMALTYWEEVAKNLKEWSLVRDGHLSAGEVRQDFIHSHGVVLQALGRSGNALLHEMPNNWETQLRVLKKIDWRRSNTKTWEGRAIVGGRLSKAQQNIILTSNVVKAEIGLPLSPEEQRIEDAYTRDK